jgi:Phage major capsid protein E
MPQMTPKGARIVDPVLSTIAQGYKNSDFVAQALFPRVDVPMRAGNIITFGKEDFMLYGNTARAPGENTKRIQIGYAGSPFALLDYGLEGKLPIEIQQEASSGANGFTIDMAAATLNKVQAIMELRLEYQSAVMARTAANYGAGNKVTLAGTAQWSDLTSGVSDPIAVIETAKEAIRAAIGKRPNVIVIAAAVWSKLKQHPKIIDRFKYTGTDVVTDAMLASLVGIKNVYIGDGIYASDAGVFADIWGKDVVIAYTETATVKDMGAPTYGYTYNLNNYPLAEEPYYDHNAKSWIFPVTRAEAPVIAAASAGFLITNAVA